jgi:hypothetical protein
VASTLGGAGPELFEASRGVEDNLQVSYYSARVRGQERPNKFCSLVWGLQISI